MNGERGTRNDDDNDDDDEDENEDENYHPEGTVPSSRGTSEAEGVSLNTKHYTLNTKHYTLHTTP